MTIDRRLFIAGLAASALTALPAFAQDTSLSGEITLAAYSGVFQDNYTKAVVEPFMKRFPNIRVNYYPAQSSAQMLGTLRAQKGSPQVDVALLDVSIARVATDEELFVPLEAANVPNLASLHDLATIEGVAGRGVTFDHLTLIYNTKAVSPAPTSWNDLWNPRFKGKFVMPGVPDIQGTALTVIANAMAGGGDPARGLDKGFARMVELAPLVQSWDPKPDAYTLVINGTADVGVGWNARSQFYKDQSKGLLDVVLPKEGSVFQINTINLVAGSKNKKAAEAFIDYALGPEAQKAFTETMFYAPTNKKAEIGKEALDRTAAGVMERMIRVDWIALAKLRDKLTEQWRRQVLPASR
ncbi:ABC transporter substrate-binding protein [Chelatococcus sp. SYSU_G07232]|uniref:ABC transporter substrate-binding protein n=1 Tax=Chelatococcus albus TaxID=3047466 RepID=A0ABT7AE22_9HYPH|nr:ABC transporter substrate-binding protein [Chelatococcus sp. SYSU_G07232]MDJ1157633.1 ABC transporter substrate-binding protein [Chelatococcus sp. SYSU_G07232]